MVSANRQLDYFGQTVNVAQRLEACAGPGEIVVQAELARPGEPWLDGLAVGPVEEVALKGIPTPMRLVRARVGG